MKSASQQNETKLAPTESLNRMNVDLAKVILLMDHVCNLWGESIACPTLELCTKTCVLATLAAISLL